MRHTKRKAVLILSLFAGIFLVFILLFGQGATTYYVDFTGGLDTNNGTSPETAWKTINKIKTLSFSPGDTIKFKRGEIWREEIEFVFPSSGASGNEITIDVYGSGPNPIIDGRNLLNNASDWIYESGNVWSISSIVRMTFCWIDERLQTQASDASSVNSTNKYYYDSGIDTLYVYATENPATAYTNPGVMINMTPTAFHLVTKSYLNINHLEFRGGTYDCVRIRAGCSYITVDNCSVKKPFCAINIGNSTPASESTNHHITLSNNTIEYDQFDYKVGDGIYLGAEVQDSTVSNNTITDAYHSGIYLYSGTGTGHDATSNNIIEHNYFFWNASSYYGRAIGVDGKEHMCTGNIIRYNYIEDQATHSQFNGNGNYIYYNIWDTGQLGYQKNPRCSAGVEFSAYGGGVSHDNYFYNNVIYKMYHGGIEFAGWTEEGNCYGHVVKNNIVIDCDANGSGYQVEYKNIPNVQDHIVQNNCFLSSTTSNLIHFKGTDYIVAEAEENLTGWANNIQQDPSFVGASSHNFTLQSTSPCIDAGVGVGLTQDYAGTTVPQGSAPDIGAYEYESELGIIAIDTSGRIIFVQEGQILRAIGRLLIMKDGRILIRIR